MSRCVVLLAVASSVSVVSQAQVSISANDLFNRVGLYYRAYANRYDPTDTSGSTAYTVPSGLIGSPGPDQFWDFSTGPTNKVFRFDYVDPAGLTEAADFPDAKVAEQMTDETDGEAKQYLFFTQVPGVGRTVYGFYAENPLFTPSNVFDPPIVDFPDTINYGMEWTTSMTYENTLNVGDPSDPEDPSGTFEVAQQITQSSSLKADAYGTILLPDKAGTFGPGLRITEDVTVDAAVDFGDGGFEHVETDYYRNLYWVMPGHGIVAQITSTQSSSPPPDHFTRAVAFIRLFESNMTNAPSGGGCTGPQAVTDLRIRISNSVILLTWSKAPCANQYKVEYSDDPANATSWKALGDPTANAFWQGENTAGGSERFYRVISLP
jgi:hypothetical protein